MRQDTKEADLLVVNAGNNMNYISLMADRESEYMIAGFNLTGLDAIGLGLWDLKLGPQRMQELAAGSVTDILCANLDGFVPFLRLTTEKYGLKVLVTAVIDPAAARRYKLDNLPFSDPVAAVNRITSRVKYDVGVLILHADQERQPELLKKFKGIDLYIDGETAKTHLEAKEYDGHKVFCNNLGGKYLSYVDLEVQNGRVSLSDQVLERVKAKTVAEDPAVAKLIDKYEVERQKFIEEEKQRRAQAQAQEAKKIMQAREIYVGSRWCGSCHGEIEQHWQPTRHARALESLKKKGREHDPDCLRCHVTGMNDSNNIGGFVSLEGSPQMVGVQCEACHSPGGRHAQMPAKHKMEKITAAKCLQCHTDETDPDFDFQRSWSVIKHPQPEK